MKALTLQSGAVSLWWIQLAPNVGHWLEKHQGLEFLYTCVWVRLCNFQQQSQARNQHSWKAPSVSFSSFPQQLGRYRWQMSRVTCQAWSCQKSLKHNGHPTPYQPPGKLFQRESDKQIYAYNSPERVMYFLRALMNWTTAWDAAIRYSCPFLLWQLASLFDGEGKGNKAGG